MTAALNIFSSKADDYLTAGFKPIPARGKIPFIKGSTGRHGEVSPEDVATWIADHGSANIALRAEGWISVDIDHYGLKVGAESLYNFESNWAETFLPKGIYSTSRGPASPARQRIFRVQANLEFQTNPIDDVDIIQRHHRCMVVWPSVHPATGGTYRWYTPDHVELQRVPRLDEFPELPQTFIDLWQKTPGAAHSGPVAPWEGDLSQFIDGLHRGGDPVPFNTTALHYSEMNVAIWRLSEMAVFGNTSNDLAAAFEEISASFINSRLSSTPEDSRPRKIADSLRSAIAKRKAELDELGGNLSWTPNASKIEAAEGR
jgi:hypothetical protein